jgi:hypothetical protein
VDHRTTIRHNTHHQDFDGYPERVTVQRPCHPFHGQSLTVFSAGTHHGEFKLVLVLPDGMRLRVPAAWTDRYRTPAPCPALLASVAQLLHARAVVNALFRRAQAASAAAPTSPKEPRPMPAQLTFLQPPPPAGAVPLWETLPREQQRVIRALLARLMRQLGPEHTRGVCRARRRGRPRPGGDRAGPGGVAPGTQ